MDMMLELLKAWGPPGIVTIILWLMLQKSEKREEKKDVRIQMLENLLTESYDERITAADRIAEAIHNNATVLSSIVAEIRAKK